jgi:hypothetical protein
MGDRMSAELEPIVVYEDDLPARQDVTPTLFGTTDPAEVVEAAKRAAGPLVDVIRSQKLAVTIGPSEHVKVEGWTLLGSMLGVFPICTWTRKLENGWEARVEARTRAGDLVGAAEAECLRSENTWKNRDDYALRSMAQTRATSKALRQPLGFVMQLAGFNPTPAEEMPQPERKSTAKKDKAPAMRKRITEMSVEADEARGELKTADEILATVKKNWNADSLDGLSEAQLSILGADLKQWAEGGYIGEFKIVPF